MEIAIIITSIVSAVYGVLTGLHSTFSNKAKIDRAKEYYEKAKQLKATTADLSGFLTDAYAIAQVNGTHAVEKITNAINNTYANLGYSSGAVETVLARVKSNQRKYLNQAEYERKLGEADKSKADNLQSQYAILSDEEKSKAKDSEGNWIKDSYAGNIGQQAEEAANSAATHFSNAADYEKKI